MQSIIKIIRREIDPNNKSKRIREYKITINLIKKHINRKKG